MSEHAKPTKPYDDHVGDPSRDEAKGGYSLYALERMLANCEYQPDWRSRSDLCCAYYDGKQLSPLQEQMIISERLDRRVTNLIRPVINSVLGQEAKTRTDVKIESDDDGYQDVVDALSPRLKEAERETMAHMAVSNGYAAMVKAGLGWVEVQRNTDPLAYPYRVEEVHRNEIWWDWQGQKGITMDRARWLVRSRWVDLDEIEAAMPKYKAVLKLAAGGWDETLLDPNFLGEPQQRHQFVENAMEAQRRWTVARRDWISTARKQVKLYEVWYRVPAEVVVLHIGPGRKVAYDPNDPRHQEAVARGLVKVTKAITSQIRKSLYAGPHRLTDEATNRRRFPYIPFFAFRDDDDMSPYGLIDPMISPQDEYTERRLRLQWMLKAKQIDIDNDALDTRYNTIADVADNAMRPDMVTVLSKDRRFESGVRRRNDLLLPAEQVAVMQDAKQLIQDVSGRYTSQLGSAPNSVTSGIANNLLIEQGEQSMGEMNDNYTFGRRMVFEELLTLIAEDHAAQDLQVLVGSGRSKRPIVLNTWDPRTGQPVNMVKDAEVRVGLGEVPASAAFRMQQQQQVAQIIAALGQNAQAAAILAPVYIESSGLPNRQDVADDLRRATGVPVPGDKAAQEQQQAAMEKERAEQAQLAKAAATAEVQHKGAQARKTMAEAAQLELAVRAGTALRESAAKTAVAATTAELNKARVAEIAAHIDQAMREASQDPDEDSRINEALNDAALTA